VGTAADRYLQAYLFIKMLNFQRTFLLSSVYNKTAKGKIPDIMPKKQLFRHGCHE